jgi:geranylgeranylglycerol-phosphate geranylgeranyltransferase
VFNDLGDFQGDKAAGRRTIPVVIGRINTVKMSMVLVVGMAASSWAIYAIGGIGLATPALVSAFAALVATRMGKTLRGLDDMEFMRKQHKKLFPLHLLLDASLIGGTLML